ncbi:MAG: hypothetical protein JO034_06995 [Singulisphaera sp.]|nr:hypothetical protein [Singulisphaera sp.]
MAISRQVRRKLVPGVDRLEPRQLLSMMSEQPGTAPLLAPALVAPATSAPHTSAATTSSTVTGLHFVTSPNVPYAGLNATSEDAPNDVWAVGSFLNTSTNLTTPLVEHFDGTSWKAVQTPPLPSGVSGQLLSVAAVSPTNVWAVGNSTGTLIEHWDGHTWSIFPSPSVGAAGSLNAVTATPDGDVWAVGAAGGVNLIEHFNTATQSWVVVPSPTPRNSHLSGVSGTSSGDVWAVGSDGRSTADQVQILHWNGQTWSAVTAPSPGLEPFLSSVVALAPNNAWAVGSTFLPINSSESALQTVIEHWDGTSWSVVSSPNAGGGSTNFLNGVAAVSANNIWAVGEFLDPNANNYQTLTEHFDGTSWSVVPSPNATTGSNGLRGVTALSSNGDVVAVGGANSANNQGSTDLILANNEPIGSAPVPPTNPPPSPPPSGGGGGIVD